MSNRFFMGNLFTSRKNRDFDSVVLDELNRPLIPSFQKEVLDRLMALEQDMKQLKQDQSNIDSRLDLINDNISHKNVTTGNDIYKINETLHKVDNAIQDIFQDLSKLVNNDKILMHKIENMNQHTTLEGLYTSETSFIKQE